MLTLVGLFASGAIGLSTLTGFHVDRWAWESELVKVQSDGWKNDFGLTLLRLQQAQDLLNQNQQLQAQYKLKRQPIPPFFTQQQFEIESNISNLKSHLSDVQAKIRAQQ